MVEKSAKSEKRENLLGIAEEAAQKQVGKVAVDKPEKNEKSFYTGFMPGIAVGICLGLAIAHA